MLQTTFSLEVGIDFGHSLCKVVNKQLECPEAYVSMVSTTTQGAVT